MGDKDRGRLQAAAFVLGVADAEGKPIPRDALDRVGPHEYLLARDMESAGSYAGPDWLPFALSQLPEKETVSCLVNSAGARELWAAIAETYEQPDRVALTLPMEIDYARQQWANTSKRTPAEHRDYCEKLKRRAESLAREVDRIESLEAMETGERFDFMRFYSEDEKRRIYTAVYLHNLRLRNTGAREIQGAALGYGLGDLAGGVASPIAWDDYIAPQDRDRPLSPTNHSVASTEAGATWELLLGDDEEWPGIVPSVADMLRRLGRFFGESAGAPDLQRPAHANAERNFVARHLCRYFRDSTGTASPSIIAVIVSMIYPQGITDNEVSQMIRKLPPPEFFHQD